jgi:hypothetical protein
VREKWTLTTGWLKFPVTDWKLPDRPNNFPVIQSKELLEKGLQHSGLLIRKPTFEATESRISL